jgi:hypothetical protein
MWRCGHVAKWMPLLAPLPVAALTNLAPALTLLPAPWTQWDDDLDGAISKREFRKAIRAFGFNAHDDELDAVFNSFDENGGGSISYRELNNILRRRSGLPSMSLDERFKMITNANRHALRRGPSVRRGKSLSADFRIDAGADADSFQAQLRKALHQNLARGEGSAPTDLFASSPTLRGLPPRPSPHTKYHLFPLLDAFARRSDRHLSRLG